MAFLAGWMTLLAGVLILRWASMTEAEQALSIITPEQIMVNVFASIVFWGLLFVTKQNTTVGGVVGMVLYVLFAMATVWAVGNKAHEINVAKGLKFGDPEWQKPIDMLTDPTAAVVHLCRLILLIFVVKANWRADEHWEVVGDTPLSSSSSPPPPRIVLAKPYLPGTPERRYTTQADLLNDLEQDWEILDESAELPANERPLPITVSAR